MDPYLDQLAEIRLRDPHFGEYLDGLANDYQRAQACRAKAEGLRNQWFAGKRRFEAQTLRANDSRVNGMDSEDRTTTGAQRWTRTQDAKDLAALEQMYWRWACGYLEWAKFDAMMSPARSVTGRIIPPAGNSGESSVAPAKCASIC